MCAKVISKERSQGVTGRGIDSGLNMGEVLSSFGASRSKHLALVYERQHIRYDSGVAGEEGESARV